MGSDTFWWPSGRLGTYRTTFRVEISAQKFKNGSKIQKNGRTNSKTSKINVFSAKARFIQWLPGPTARGGAKVVAYTFVDNPIVQRPQLFGVEDKRLNVTITQKSTRPDRTRTHSCRLLVYHATHSTTDPLSKFFVRGRNARPRLKTHLYCVINRTTHPAASIKRGAATSTEISVLLLSGVQTS